MHRLSVISLAALLLVGGVLAFVVFASPHSSAAPSPAQPAVSHTATASTGSTNSSLLAQPPPSTGGGGDDGSGSDN